MHVDKSHLNGWKWFFTGGLLTKQKATTLALANLQCIPQSLFGHLHPPAARHPWRVAGCLRFAWRGWARMSIPSRLWGAGIQRRQHRNMGWNFEALQSDMQETAVITNADLRFNAIRRNEEYVLSLDCRWCMLTILSTGGTCMTYASGYLLAPNKRAAEAFDQEFGGRNRSQRIVRIAGRTRGMQPVGKTSTPNCFEAFAVTSSSSHHGGHRADGVV